MADQTDITILPAEVGDAALMARFSQHSFSDKFGHLYRRSDLERFLAGEHNEEVYAKFLSDPAYGVWKAVAPNGEIVGYAVASDEFDLPVDHPVEGGGEVKRLYVSSRYQNEGVGRKMMDIMMEWLDRNGPRAVYLSVYKFNEGAQRFYGRYGFSFLQEYIFRVGDHKDPEFIFARLP